MTTTAAVPTALLAQAQKLAETQRLAEAVAVLAGSDHPECDYRRASLLMLLKRWPEAEAAYRRVLKTAPNHLDTALGLASALIEQDRAAEALPLLGAAARAQPGSGRIRYLHGIALDEAGRATEAEAELRVARDLVIRPADARKLVPWEIYLQVSRRCNLRCAMCGHEVWQSNSGFMEPDVFDRVLEQAKANGIDTLHILSGQGEPLLHPRIFEMLEQAVAGGFKVGIVTNGTPLTPDRINRLAGLGLAYIQFSFAGWDKDSYEGVYVGARFEKVIENLKAMDAALPPGGKTSFAVKAVAAGDWKTTLEKTKGFLSGHGIERVYTVIANNFGGTVQCGGFHEKHGVWSQKSIAHHRRMPCRVLLKAVGVFCDGTVTACGCYDSNAELKIGHIMEQDLAAIRQGQAFRTILDAFRSGDLAGIPMCGKCDDPFG
ncbi:MAG TPA: radical SAM protein [Candidatus Omnitrophota bacterium]|nr:radical SAM protein [Candidatus Omnitrophota bacterium]